MALRENFTVFIIDDNELFARLLTVQVEKSLEGTSGKVLVFEDGESALKHIHLKPALVITDQHLDGKKETAQDGLKIIKLIQEESPDTDFIMVTIDEKTELFLRSRESGIYDYITKGPITPYKLGLSVERWLNLKK